MRGRAGVRRQEAPVLFATLSRAPWGLFTLRPTEMGGGGGAIFSPPPHRAQSTAIVEKNLLQLPRRVCETGWRSVALQSEGQMSVLFSLLSTCPFSPE